MKNLLLIAVAVILSLANTWSQDLKDNGKYLPRPTIKGIGKIDTRIDNMGYWKKMADSGYVEVAAFDNVPPAQFTGSLIENRSVMTTDSPDVPVASNSTTQSENSVFIDPDNVFSILNSNNSVINPYSSGGLYGANYLMSDDGGLTWDGSVNGAGGDNSGDPAAAIGRNGKRFIGFINNASGQSVAYSADGGSTWTAVACGNYNGGLLDKNHMWIDNSSTSAYEGNIYSAWTDFGITNTNQIMITRSTDDGLTYSAPVNISSAVAAGSHNQGVNLQTGPNGEVYAVWAIYDSWHRMKQPWVLPNPRTGGPPIRPLPGLSAISGVSGRPKPPRHTGSTPFLPWLLTSAAGPGMATFTSYGRMSVFPEPIRARILTYI